MDICTLTEALAKVQAQLETVIQQRPSVNTHQEKNVEQNGENEIHPRQPQGAHDKGKSIMIEDIPHEKQNSGFDCLRGRVREN